MGQEWAEGKTGLHDKADEPNHMILKKKDGNLLIKSYNVSWEGVLLWPIRDCHNSTPSQETL